MALNDQDHEGNTNNINYSNDGDNVTMTTKEVTIAMMTLCKRSTNNNNNGVRQP